MVGLSIVTNSALLAFSSSQLASFLPDFYRVATARDVAAMELDHIADTEGHIKLLAKDGSRRHVVLLAFLIEHIVFLLAFMLRAAIPQQPAAIADELERLQWEKEVATREARTWRQWRLQKDRAAAAAATRQSSPKQGGSWVHKS
jgi:hypothetical protein